MGWFEVATAIENRDRTAFSEALKGEEDPGRTLLVARRQIVRRRKLARFKGSYDDPFSIERCGRCLEELVFPPATPHEVKERELLAHRCAKARAA